MCRTNQTGALVEEVKKLQAIQPTVAAQRATNQGNDEDDSDDDSSDEEDNSVRLWWHDFNKYNSLFKQWLRHFQNFKTSKLLSIWVDYGSYKKNFLSIIFKYFR